MNKKIRRYVIAGGGTAGWMAAAMLAKTMGDEIELTLVESESVGTVGVGEATIPPLLRFNQLIGINEADFMRETRATFKLGISFEGWKDIGQDYFHSFGHTGKDHWTCGFHHFWRCGMDRGLASHFDEYCLEVVAGLNNKFAQLPNNGLNYAYHLDAGRFAKMLRRIAEENGAKRIEGKIQNVNLHSENGHIASLQLDSGAVVEGDFFVDCTGFRSLLMGKALHVGYDDWSHYLPCDSAIAIQTESAGPMVPYTRSIAHDAGWRWRIPLQHRTGNGLVYCERHLSKDQALDRLLTSVEGKTTTDPNFIRFQTGARRKQWEKNCVVLGLAGGFMEPLESTSIHLIQKSVMRFMRLLPQDGLLEADIKEFNDQTFDDMLSIRDFLILHYKVTERNDSEFWRFCANMDIPDTLQQKIELFEESGRVFRKNEELFAENSWIQVMLGQGITPKTHHPIADKMSDEELTYFLGQIQRDVAKIASQLPAHVDYVKQYCGAEEIQTAEMAVA